MAVAVFVLACVLALFAPLLVHAIVLGGVLDALRHLFAFGGGLLAEEIALVYVVALAVIAIAGGLTMRGRRVPPILLHAAAFAPLAWAIGGCVVRDRARVGWLDAFGFGRDNVTDFAYDAGKAQAMLDVAATMSAFAMILVAFAAIVRHESRRDGAGTLLVACFSAALFVATAIYAYGRYALFGALVQSNDRDRFGFVRQGLLVANATRVVAMALVVVSIVVAVLMARRVRGPGGKSAFAFLVVVALSLAVPRAIAARDDALFRVPNPSAAPDGVQVPVTDFTWSSPRSNHEPRLVVRRDGAGQLDTRDGKLVPMTSTDFDHGALGCVVDRDATVGAFQRVAASATNKPWWLTFYVAPAHPPDFSSEGTLASFIGATGTTAEVRFGDPEVPYEEHYVFITLEDLTLRIWREGSPELVAPATNDAAADATRRLVFGAVSELFVDQIYIRAREGDTLARIWGIADDIRAVVHHSKAIALTTHEHVDRAAYRRKHAGEATF